MLLHILNTVTSQYIFLSLVHPEMIVFGRTLCFTTDVYFFCQHKISEMHRLIGTKFCTVINSRPNFIMPSKILGLPPKKNKNLWEKHAKLGPISDDFKIWRRISPEWMKIFEIGPVHFVP